MAWTSKEEADLLMSASQDAARRIEDAWDRHGVHVICDPMGRNGVIRMEITTTAGHAMADWLNAQADAQRPGDGS